METDGKIAWMTIKIDDPMDTPAPTASKHTISSPDHTPDLFCIENQSLFSRPPTSLLVQLLSSRVARQCLRLAGAAFHQDRKTKGMSSLGRWTFDNITFYEAYENMIDKCRRQRAQKNCKTVK
jgi:hypothetical protein